MLGRVQFKYLKASTCLTSSRAASSSNFKGNDGELEEHYDIYRERRGAWGRAGRLIERQCHDWRTRILSTGILERSKYARVRKRGRTGKECDGDG
jgi:hypothetical protein